MSADAFLAVDWGTTNRRVFRIERGAVTPRGSRRTSVTAVRDFAAEVAAIRARMGDLPMLLAGMAGSTIGWRDAGYVPAPAGLDSLAERLLLTDPRTAIVPGVCCREGDRGDVMRGEEVQVLGAVAAGLAPPDAIMVQPGTHSKWVDVVDGRIARFVTAMTGELFGLIRAHGILSPQLGGTVVAGPAFADGVRRGAARDVTAALFGIRAGALLGLRDDADAAAYASGVLIGAEVAARLAVTREHRIHIIAEPSLGALYGAAIAQHGREPVAIDGDAAFVAGITHIGACFA